MTAEELDFGTTLKFTADSFNSANLGAERADTESYSSNVYWQIAVDTEDLEDLD
jgi:hypothetical protein